MMTRKMKKSVLSTVDNVKTLQDDLNKSQQLNEVLLSEQDDHEKEFKLLLETNLKLKKDLLKMENSCIELQSECDKKDLIISNLTTEIGEMKERMKQISTPANDTIQKLQDHLNLVENLNIDLQNTIKTLEETNIQLHADIHSLNIEGENLKKKITQTTTNNKDASNIKSQLIDIRRELRFKRTELKTLRKKNIMNMSNVNVKKTEDIRNENLNIKTLQLSLNKSETNVQLLENSLLEMRHKINILEHENGKVKNLYANLEKLHKENEKEKRILEQTMEEIEKTLEEDNTCINKNAIKPPNKNRKQATIIIENKGLRGLGTMLTALEHESQKCCCFSYTDAPAHHLIEVAKKMAENENEVTTIVIVTRRIEYNSIDSHIKELISLQKTLKKRNIKLVCTNLPYICQDASAANLSKINQRIYEANIKLHNYATYEEDLAVINISDTETLSSISFKNMIKKFIVAYNSNIRSRETGDQSIF